MSDENKNPLEETFDLPEDEDFKDELLKIDIPKDPSLDDIAGFALKAYVDHMADITHMEPKFRARNLEVAQLFLKLAQEALGKKEDVRLKDEKLDFDKDKNFPNKNNNSPEKTRGEILLEHNKKISNMK